MQNKPFALITGATSGFGYEFAKLFAADGYNLVLVARIKERLEEVADELSSRYDVVVVPIIKDLFHPTSAKEIYSEIRQHDLEVEVLVNNAGQGEHGLFIDTDLQREIEIIQLNTISLVSLTKLFLKEMVARNRGKILQVGSVVSKLPSPLMAVYSGTKAFVYNFSESLINELKDTNVTMTLLLPGASDTDFFHKANATESKVYREGELSDPAEVALDGYKAMMEGKSKIISGLKNKVQVGMSNIIPEQTVAANLRKQMEESKKEEGREFPDHSASSEEREVLDRKNLDS